MTTPMGIRNGRYRSLFESAIAHDLERKGTDFTYEGESVPYTITHTYTPDFKLPNGIFIEAKGFFTGEDRTKLITVKKQHPDLDIRLLFMNPNQRLSRKSKTTYASWCERHGFKWAAKFVPQAWIDE